MFDAVNLSLTGRDGFGSHTEATVTGNTKGRTYKPRSVRSDEVKAADSLGDSLNSLDFEPTMFAYFISQKSAAVNVRMFKAFERLLTIWAERLSDGMARTPEEEAIGVEAQRIIEAYNFLFRGDS